jgi:membrane protein required for colicin V production
MGWVDIALLAVLAISVIVGALRGLVFELMSLVGWVVAYFAAHWLAADVAPHLPIGEPGGRSNLLAAFVVTFLGALFIWAVASRVVRLMLHATPLGVPDRLLGAMFGTVRGLVVLIVLVTAVSMTPFSTSPEWRASMGVPWVLAAVTGLKPVLPVAISKYLPA